MRLYFGLIGVALLIAALSGAALSWDGSYYLFKVLDTGRPFAPPNRYAGYVLHQIVLAVRSATDDMTVLQTVFGLTYTAIPLAALAGSWWVVRRQAPALFVWPAFSIGLGVLPGLFYFVGEGIQVVALFWPILLATLLGLPRSALPIVAVFGVLAFLTHPLAATLFLICGLVAAWIGATAGGTRRGMLAAAAVFGVLAVARFMMHVPAPNAEVTSLPEYVAGYQVAVRGYPLVIVGSAWFAACMVLVAALVRKPSEPEVTSVVHLFQFIGLTLAGVLALDWARHPRLWANALQFTDFAVLTTFPFMALAIIEGIVGKGFLLRHGPALMERRLRLIQGTAAVFVGVLSIQSMLFSNLSNDLTQLIGQSTAPCISTPSLGELQGTPLGHWSVSTFAIALQGRSPQKVLLDGEGCVAARSSGAFRVVEWDSASGGTGWFDLSLVRSRAEAARACWFSVSPSWYGVERGWYADWWRWSAGRGQVHVFVGQEMQVTMRAQLRSLRQPNQIEILLNGERQTVENLTLADFNPMTPLALTFRAGENTIDVLSGMPALQVPNDSRPLALAIKNLDFIPQEPGLMCELQP